MPTLLPKQVLQTKAPEDWKKVTFLIPCHFTLFSIRFNIFITPNNHKGFAIKKWSITQGFVTFNYKQTLSLNAHADISSRDSTDYIYSNLEKAHAFFLVYFLTAHGKKESVSCIDLLTAVCLFKKSKEELVAQW